MGKKHGYTKITENNIHSIFGRIKKFIKPGNCTNVVFLYTDKRGKKLVLLGCCESVLFDPEESMDLIHRLIVVEKPENIPIYILTIGDSVRFGGSFIEIKNPSHSGYYCKISYNK